jgi:Fe2+ or Zn2+ uptake regulation protein
MMNRDYEAIGDIQAELLGYLEEHPEAADSLDAIQQWWILQRVYRYSRATIQCALDQLVKARLVERKVMTDGREVYKRSSLAQAQH